MPHTAYAIAAAAIAAACFVAFPSLSAQVEAHAQPSGVKVDRADIRPLAAACSQRGWPYYQAACLRDVRNPYGRARQVRLVAVDHQTPAGATTAR